MNTGADIAMDMNQPHPLLLYPVLINILKKSSFESLLSMRQTCKIWKYHADRLVHQNSRIVVTGNKNLAQLVSIMKNSKENSDEFPCTNFIFKNMDLNLDINQGVFLNYGSTIRTLELKGCLWTSGVLRDLIFRNLPNLQSLVLEIDYDSGNNSTLPILPMSFGTAYQKLPALKSLRMIGDFSRQADVIFDILKQSSNLQLLALNKYTQTQDDLFGVWLFEIILAFKFKKLSYLEFDCSLIPMQVDSLLEIPDNALPLRRISLNLTQVEYSVIFQLMRKFKLLESAEFQLNDPPPNLISLILKTFPEPRPWVAIHTNPTSKFSFPLRNIGLGIDLE